MRCDHRQLVEAELDRQIATLLAKGYPAIARMSEAEFVGRLEPLKDKASDLPAPGGANTEGTAPFVIVVSTEVVPADQAMPLTELGGNPGFVVADMDAEDLASFRPIQTVSIPDGVAYLLAEIDTGRATLNVAPIDALVAIEAAGRSPLTIGEGIALITQHPHVLRKNACFSLLASRSGDRRVPAVWISGRKPKLGWCWNGNPHTWLGSASCSGRLG